VTIRLLWALKTVSGDESVGSISEPPHRSVTVLAMPDIQTQFETLGVQPRIVTPPELAEFIASEARRWADVARAAKIEKE